MDLMIMRFREKLVQDINESPLPLEVKRLVLSEIITKVEIATNEAIQKELKEEEEDGQSVQ